MMSDIAAAGEAKKSSKVERWHEQDKQEHRECREAEKQGMQCLEVERQREC